MEVVRDTFWGGRLTFWQPARGAGYRFNIDPVILASFVQPGGEHAIDLGAGCGILGILLLAAGVVRRLTAVEVQPEMAALVQRNAEANGLAHCVQVLCSDLRYVTLPVPADRVVFNPPYFAANAGAASPVRSRDIARREQYGTLADFVALTARCLGAQGQAAAIVRAERGGELATLAQVAGLPHMREQPVAPRPGEPPKHVLMEMSRGAAARQVLPPIAVHEAGSREFTATVRPWVEGSLPGVGTLAT